MTVFAGDDELLAFLHHEPHGKIILKRTSSNSKSRCNLKKTQDGRCRPIPAAVLPRPQARSVRVFNRDAFQAFRVRVIRVLGHIELPYFIIRTHGAIRRRDRNAVL